MLIFEESPNPSTDYYIKPLLKHKNLNYKTISFKDFEINQQVPASNTLIIVRYLNRKLKHWIENNRKKVEKIVYFMDDDLFDFKVLKYLPKRYAWKIFSRAYLYKDWLRKIRAEFWVSNEYLANKYSHLNPKVVLPYPIYIKEEEEMSKNQAFPLVFYHATASHIEEFYWLKKLLLKLEQEKLIVELVGDKKIGEMYKGIRNIYRVDVMPWKEYLKFVSLKYRHIGLALLFNNPFNKARSWVKFFNIVKSGAVGIYSENFPIAELIKDFNAGIVLPMDVKLWKDAIISLLDEERRKELFAESLKLTEYLKEKALKSYDCL